MIPLNHKALETFLVEFRKANPSQPAVLLHPLDLLLHRSEEKCIRTERRLSRSNVALTLSVGRFLLKLYFLYIDHGQIYTEM